MASQTPVSSAQPGRFVFDGRVLYSGENPRVFQQAAAGYWFTVLPKSVTYVADDFGNLAALAPEADAARLAYLYRTGNPGAAEYAFERAQDLVQDSRRAAGAADEALRRARNGLLATLPPEVQA